MRHILTTLLFCLAALTAGAQNVYFAHGVARCILDDGSGQYPVSEAGEVFVGTSADEAPLWTAGSHTSATISGTFSGSASVTFHFWARAKAGYTFLGWGTTNTSKTASSGTLDMEGRAWASKTTLWSAGTADAPKELVRYAIFRKNAGAGDVELPGAAVPLSSVSGTDYTFGSATSEWRVKLTFAEPLAYRDVAGYSEGYGVQSGLISAITCTDAATGHRVNVINARVYGSPTAGGDDAYGLLYMPASMPVGTYDVHLPEGLFFTSGGGHSAACDFQIRVLPDNDPFTIVSSSPSENYTWNADPEATETDGETILVMLNFNKIIARVTTGDPAIELVNTKNGCERRYSRISISQLNRHNGIISFDALPNGDYTFKLPADVFFDQNGLGNAPLTLHFTVIGSSAAAWQLPVYTDATPSVSNNATVGSLDRIEYSLTRRGYSAPCALTSKAAVTAVKITESYEGLDPYDPDTRPEIVSEPIEDVTLAIEDGRLLICFPQTFYEAAKVLITVPAGAIINVANASSMSAEQLYKAGGCTNGPLQLTVNIVPSNPTSVAPQQATVGTIATEVFTIDGIRTQPSTPRTAGVSLVRTRHTDGTVSVRKVIQR